MASSAELGGKDAKDAVELDFASGTLELRGPLPESLPEALSACRWDARTRCYRAPARAYPSVVRWLAQQGIEVKDRARGYQRIEIEIDGAKKPRPYQLQALEAWRAAQGQGIVSLPTGAGKTHVGLMAIADRSRSTLVVAPTLDLVRQWYDVLSTAFGVPVGLVGGGDWDVQPLTVTTYDSAHLHVDKLGARFGLLIFDEVHHLPSPSYRNAAQFSLAPFRLGLTATPEMDPEQTELLHELVGPVVYRRTITELSGDYLADYDTERIGVELSEQERAAYDEARGVYLGFLRRQKIRLGGPNGWNQFLRQASRSAEGRRALDAYRRQRALSVAASAKIHLLADLLFRHRQDRALVFTLDNATAYEISRRCLVPIITHHTRVRERSEILARFAAGDYGVLVTSKVLNEGVDVPDANVAVVVSGTGSVREHVQRLGRILRPQPGKRAMLYELITIGTGETSTSERRREHVAYRS